MSRLDSVIRRLQAQRDCLNAAAAIIADLPGPILELGLGNGRTYDHIRDLFPRRDVYAFDRQVRAHPDRIPDSAHLFLGDVHDSLPDAKRRLGRSVALAHVDLGSGRADLDAPLAAYVGAALAEIVRPGGLVLSDQSLPAGDSLSMKLPASVPAGRYFMYRLPLD